MDRATQLRPLREGLSVLHPASTRVNEVLDADMLVNADDRTSLLELFQQFVSQKTSGLTGIGSKHANTPLLLTGVFDSE